MAVLHISHLSHNTYFTSIIKGALVHAHKSEHACMLTYVWMGPSRKPLPQGTVLLLHTVCKELQNGGCIQTTRQDSFAPLQDRKHPAAPNTYSPRVSTPRIEFRVNLGQSLIFAVSHMRLLPNQRQLRCLRPGRLLPLRKGWLVAPASSGVRFNTQANAASVDRWQPAYKLSSPKPSTCQISP